MISAEEWERANITVKTTAGYIVGMFSIIFRILSRQLDGMTFYATYVLDMSTIYYK